MNKAPAIIFLLLTALTTLTFFSCDYNVYMDEDGLWMVDGKFFSTLQAAMDYIYKSTMGKSLSDVPAQRRAILQRNVMNGKRGGGLIVPEDFEGALVIDFNGLTYEFDNSLDHFFDIRGGNPVYIINGTTVIYNEASHVPFAIAVNTDTVTIDDHLIDDRRWDPVTNTSDAKLFDVGVKGNLLVTNTAPSSSGTTLSGVISIATDGVENGGRIQITNSELVITNIYTTYQDSEGNILDKIPDAVTPAPDSKSIIDILSGTVEIQAFNQGSDYWDGDQLYRKAVLNIVKGDPEKNTLVKNPHSIDSIVEKIVNSVTDPSEKAEKEVIHDLYDDWTTLTEPDCTTSGLQIRYCHYEECDIDGNHTKYSQTREIPALGHDLTHHEAIPASCTEEGNIEYWLCNRFHEYFSDAECLHDITQQNTITPALGHDWSTDWSYDNTNHWHVCLRCGEKKDTAEHEFLIVFDADTTARKVTIQSYCSVCEKHHENTTTSATGSFDISISVGIDVVRTAPGVNEWLINVQESVISRNRDYKCKWCGQNGTNLSDLEGTDPITIAIGDDVENGSYQIIGEFFDENEVLKDTCILVLQK